MSERDELLSAIAAWDIGLYHYEPSTGAIRGSDVFYRLHGIQRDARVTPSSVRHTLHPADRRKLHHAVSRAITADDSFDVTYRVLDSAGQTRWLRNRGRRDKAHLYIEPRALCVYGSVVDISAEVELRAQLEASAAHRAELQDRIVGAQRVAATGRLVGSVAHDFKNILSVVMGSASLLLSKVTDGESRVELEQIISASYQAEALVGQLLDFSRSRALSHESLDAAEVIESMRPMLCRLAGERAALKFRRGAGSTQVRAQRHHVEQILINLVVNARDAMPNGGELVIECTRADADASVRQPVPDAVTLSVSDTGMGMDAATRERAFEAFFTTKGPGLGTGLGLATVHDLVHECGGTVSLSSEVGHGTRATIRLPGGNHG